MEKSKTCLVRKLLCSLLAMLLASVFIVPVSADEIAQDSAASSEPTLISRIVYPEVTDPEELLEMAMEQEPVPMTRSAAAPENDEITVTQLLEEQTYSDGSTKKVYAQTALLVLDDEGNKMTRSKYAETSRTSTKSFGNITATQTLYADSILTSPMYTERVRINRVTTTLYDMGLAVPVTKFIHSISKNDFENNKIVNTQTITSPQMGMPYTYYNPSQILYGWGDVSVQLQTGAEIYLANGQSFELVTIFMG